MNDTATRGAPASRTLPASRGGARSGGPRRSPRSTRGRAAPGPGMRRIIARAPRQPPAVSRLASITDALAQTEASTAPAARQEKCRGVALAGRRSRGRSRHDPPRWLDDGRAGGFLRSRHGKRHGPGRPAASPLTVRHAREARAGGHGNCSGAVRRRPAARWGIGQALPLVPTARSGRRSRRAFAAGEAVPLSCRAGTPPPPARQRSRAAPRYAR